MSARETDVEQPGQLVRRSDVTLERVGDEAVLHDAIAGRAHVVNGSAARLWELCDGSRDLDAATVDFAAGYGLTPAEVQADVASVVASLRSLGLLV